MQKKLSALAAGSIAIGLLLGTNIALAEEVCLDGDTVLGIKGLDVITDEYGDGDIITIDVKFTYATGYQIYGSGLDNFPFNAGTLEEDLIAMNLQINASLDAANPIPESAGIPGQNSYFIGGDEDAGLIAAYGSENAFGIWESCTQEVSDCAFGAKVLNPNDRHTYAELSSTTGGSKSKRKH